MAEYSSDICTGGAATCSRAYSTYVIDNAFDNNPATMWDCYPASYPEWAKYTLAEGVFKKPSRYTITSPVMAGYPVNWKFYGVADGVDYELDSRSGEVFSAGVMKTYDFDNSSNYNAFKWVFSAGSNNDMTVTQFQIMELLLPEIDITLESILEDTTSNFLLSFPGLGFENITVEYSLVAETFDDFAVLAEYQAVYYKDLAARFELVQADAYNFTDISVLFETLLGESYENVSVIFSIVKESQSFKSYILQKLYCVVSYPEGNFYYNVVLRNWNVSPNKTWFVSVIGYAVDEYETGNLITLYDTLIDLQSHTNAVSYGYLNIDTLEVVLTAVDEYDEDPAYYYQDLQYHLMLSGIVAEGDEYTYKVKPLTDLDEIRHPIYNNSNIALSRGEAELDLHTYAVLGRELVLGIHLPIIEPGDVVNLTSTRREETAKKSQVLGETITGSISEDGTTSLITSINVANYLELSR